jgi:hypothetical protein
MRSEGVSHNQRRCLALATLGVALSLSGHGARAETLRERVEACAANRDDGARLHCFDELAKALPNEKPAEAASETQELRRTTPAIQSAHIVSVSQSNGRNYRIVLDNDQVWQESEHVRDLELMPGQAVRIKAGVLGSFYLILDSGGSTRVRRIR